MNDKELPEYIKRFLSGQCSEEDLRQVMQDVQENKNLEIYNDYLKKNWLDSLDLENTAEEEQIYNEESTRLLQKLTRKRTVFQRLKPVIAIAASILVLLGVVYGSLKYKSFNQIWQVDYAEIQTGVGETRTVTLADGTQVTLNACSKLVYPGQFLEDERKVELTGQAFFKVARNEDKPFIVHTDRFNVKVLGTEFDVRAYTEDEILSVNVESGKVQVDMPEAMTRLVANEKLIINTLNNNYYKETGSGNVAVWRSGNLLFKKTPLKEVAKELERVYKCKITFKEGQSFDNLISGEHSNKSLESVLESLEYTSAIYYTRKTDTDEIMLYKK
ncbi:FecR family protein [Dysgonomonas sp. ZJ709]|uniref:FecR family protein n=1 Tax=Dysgonomonas sp. ZJ709 TaxID=2709797 RepID=UPI0013ED1CF7|nr:FecR domain-containing protein [Dysgonomonas sp. ZJ709]